MRVTALIGLTSESPGPRLCELLCRPTLKSLKNQIRSWESIGKVLELSFFMGV